MRAMILPRLDGPGALELRRIERKPLGRKDVRLAIHAAGLNFADILMCEGKYQATPPVPFVPGMEAAGEVIETGPDVDGVFVGDRVMARMDQGAFAEEAVVRDDDCTVMPQGMPYETGAAFPIVYGTAHVALAHRARLQPGEVLLVHGAAGGVGLAAVEVGKALGATVVATAGGAEKLAVAKAHGADHLIDYRTEDVRDRVRALVGGADVVFDPVGGDVFKASLRCTNPEGRLIVVGFAGGEVQQIPANILLVKNVDVIGFYWGGYAEIDPMVIRRSNSALVSLFADGRLDPLVSHVLPLEEAAQGLALLAGRKATGKVVLKVR